VRPDRGDHSANPYRARRGHFDDVEADIEPNLAAAEPTTPSFLRDPDGDNTVIHHPPLSPPMSSPSPPPSPSHLPSHSPPPRALDDAAHGNSCIDGVRPDVRGDVADVQRSALFPRSPPFGIVSATVAADAAADAAARRESGHSDLLGTFEGAFAFAAATTVGSDLSFAISGTDHPDDGDNGDNGGNGDADEIQDDDIQGDDDIDIDRVFDSDTDRVFDSEMDRVFVSSGISPQQYFGGSEFGFLSPGASRGEMMLQSPPLLRDAQPGLDSGGARAGSPLSRASTAAAVPLPRRRLASETMLAQIPSPRAPVPPAVDPELWTAVRPAGSGHPADTTLENDIARIRERWEHARGGVGTPSLVYAIPRAQGPESSFSTVPSTSSAASSTSSTQASSISSSRPAATGGHHRQRVAGGHIIHRPGRVPVPRATHRLHTSVQELGTSTAVLRRGVLALRHHIRKLNGEASANKEILGTRAAAAARGNPTPKGATPPREEKGATGEVAGGNTLRGHVRQSMVAAAREPRHRPPPPRK
jgi:hypothetical protein